MRGEVVRKGGSEGTGTEEKSLTSEIQAGLAGLDRALRPVSRRGKATYRVFDEIHDAVFAAMQGHDAALKLVGGRELWEGCG